MIRISKNQYFHETKINKYNSKLLEIKTKAISEQQSCVNIITNKTSSSEILIASIAYNCKYIDEWLIVSMENGFRKLKFFKFQETKTFFEKIYQLLKNYKLGYGDWLPQSFSTNKSFKSPANKLCDFLIRNGMEENVKLFRIDEHLTSQKCFKCALTETTDKRMQPMIYDNSNREFKIDRQNKTIDFAEFKYDNIFNPTQNVSEAKEKKQIRLKNKLESLKNKKNLNEYEQNLKIKLETPAVAIKRKHRNHNRTYLYYMKKKAKEQEEKGIKPDLSNAKTHNVLICKNKSCKRIVKGIGLIHS